jgi:hypothetical protein
LQRHTSASIEAFSFAAVAHFNLMGLICRGTGASTADNADIGETLCCPASTIHYVNSSARAETFFFKSGNRKLIFPALAAASQENAYQYYC